MMDLVDAVEGAAGSEEYINGAARKVADAVRAGKTYPGAAPRDNQLHGLVKLPIVVARYVGASLLATSHPPSPNRPVPGAVLQHTMNLQTHTLYVRHGCSFGACRELVRVCAPLCLCAALRCRERWLAPKQMSL